MLDGYPLSTKQTAAVIIGGIFVFAGIAWFLGGAAGMEFAGIVTSGILTAALVILYFRQTTLLEDQIDLRAQELNREVRQSHTETLRERVYAWLGTDDVPRTIDDLNDIFESSEGRLPKVTATDVKPPEDSFYSDQSTEDFQVVPFGLEDDRYFVDLLKNHAPELDERKDTIEAKHSTFVDLRAQFEEEFEGISLNQESLTVEPGVYLTRWVFEGIVKIERGQSGGWDDKLTKVEDIFKGGDNFYREDGNIQFMEDNLTRQTIYIVTSEKRDIEDISDDRARRLAIEAIQDTVDRVNHEDQPYQKAVEAAEILDTLQDEIRELRMELIEYAGRPVFPGECEYLDEAAIEGPENR